MNIVVIGETAPLASKLAMALRERGHEASVIAASDFTDVLTNAAVVVDVSDPICEDASAAERFVARTRRLLEREAEAGVAHHVALSTVGVEHLAESPYFRARCAQEQLIAESGIPYSIVRTTQLFEDLGVIADATTRGTTIHVPPAIVQLIGAEDVTRALAEIVVSPPLNGTIEIGGPEPFYLDELLERVLGARNDPRRVIVDPQARYFGADVSKRSLVADDEALLGEIRFDDWLRDATLPCPGACAGAAIEHERACATNVAHEFRVSDVLPGSVLLLGDVAVFSAGGGLCATQALCTHRAGPLSEGAIDDVTVTCPLHGAQFNIWTGAVLRGPAQDPLKTYRVIVDGDIGRVDVG